MTTFVHTFIGARPPARTDAVHWTQVQIESASAEGGPWTVVETKTLDPIDADPAHPQSRNLTFSSILAAGFFRLTFVDGEGSNSTPTDAVYDDGSGSSWRPSIAEVAAYVRHRTYSSRSGTNLGGQLVGTFNDDTRPTAAQVEELIDKALFEVEGKIERTITDDREIRYAKSVVATRAAMGVELEYAPREQTDSEDSTYTKLKELYEDGVAVLSRSASDTNQTSKGIYSIPVTGATASAALAARER